MAYQIRFTDQILNSPLQVEDNTINQSTSLDFPGRNVTGYGQLVGESLLHLLENFAAKSPPINPIKGQLYYNANDGVNQLELYNGTQWVPAGGLKKGTDFPSSSNSVAGDLFSNTASGELYFYTGGGWILIGPETPSASRTGVLREVLNDGNSNAQNVVSIYAEGVRLAIITQATFDPNPRIDGYSTLEKGMNLNANYGGITGTATSSFNMTVDKLLVPAENFLRADKTVASTVEQIIKSERGITIGPEGQLKLTSDQNVAVLAQNTPNSSLEIRVNNNGVIKPVVTVDSSERVGINKQIPTEALDIVGSIAATGQIRTTNIDTATSVGTGSGVFAGGVSIASNLIVGAGAEINATLKANSILPSVPLGSLITSTGVIGSETLKYQRIFAERFDGNFYGKLVGTFEGIVISGSAPKLSSLTKFKIAGDMVDEDGIRFDGSFMEPGETPLEKVFTTTLNTSFITTKLTVNSSTNADEFLLSRGTPASLRKITKKDLFASIPKTPIGAVISYAGAQAPRGWLLCDGSEVQQNEYTALFSVIQYVYGDFAVLKGRDSFKLPDLRGRFPLGLDNMDGNNRVLDRLPNSTGGFSPIATISGPAGRVADIQSRFLGGSEGSSNVFINRTELPEHKHDMKGTLSNGAKGAQYYAYLPEVGTPAELDAVPGQATPGISNFGKLLKNSGGLLTSDGTVHQQTAMDVMNPYLSLSYIIYAGTDQ